MIGIYAIFRKSDDKCMYVGESRNIEGRIHVHELGNSHINLSTEWYSKILETFDFYDKQNQLDREAHWINELNPELNEIRNRQHSEEYKNKFRGENNPAKRPEVRRRANTL